LADPKHPDHKAMKEWIGDELDQTEFNLEQVNAVLKSI